MKQKLFLCLPVLALIGLLPFPMDAASTATGTGHEESRTSLQQKKAVRTLTGTVTDASTGEFLVGVSIRIKGTSQGTITDLNGEFSIQVTSDTELEVTYIGYKKQTLLVGDLGVMAIRMQSDDEVLDEIVIIGAGTQKKVSVTGSISTIEGSTLKSPSSSLTNALAGKLAGVISMTQTGEPGANQNFYIRGINTFGGVATPLILLDGVEISVGDLNNIPPESIESFSILKDASATAIYGNRGAMTLTAHSRRFERCSAVPRMVFIASPVTYRGLPDISFSAKACLHSSIISHTPSSPSRITSRRDAVENEYSLSRYFISCFEVSRSLAFKLTLPKNPIATS